MRQARLPDGEPDRRRPDRKPADRGPTEDIPAGRIVPVPADRMVRPLEPNTRKVQKSESPADTAVREKKRHLEAAGSPVAEAES